MIRTIRPDVIVGFVFDGEGGGQHHQSSSRLTLQAFRAAADPNALGSSFGRLSDGSLLLRKGRRDYRMLRAG
jgi:LmbE family N-acetylglucosaminyl deacetylase